MLEGVLLGLATALTLLPACGPDPVYWGSEPSITVSGPHHLVGEVKNAGDIDGDGIEDLSVDAGRLGLVYGSMDMAPGVGE